MAKLDLKDVGYLETRIAFPFSDVVLMTKITRFSTVIAIAMIDGRVVIFDAVSPTTSGKAIITYVSEELDKDKLEKKFNQVIGKMARKNPADKYFLTDFENHPIPHLSNGEGAEELNPIEIEELERKVDIIVNKQLFDDALRQLLR